MPDLGSHPNVRSALSVLTGLLENRTPLIVAWSSGKDSSVVLSLALEAARRIRASGNAPAPIVVSHSDTLIENPEVHALARRELGKIECYAAREGLPLEVVIATPALSDHWAVRVLGGRRLPSFGATNRDCTVDFKIRPQQRARAAVMRRLAAAGWGEAVIITGSRFDESDERRRRMLARGDSSDSVRRNERGERVLAPIATWTSDEVFDYLGVVGARGTGYSDFREVLRLYADAGASSCAVVSDAVTSAWKRSRPCSARMGCLVCCAVSEDRSLTNLVAYDPQRYGYLGGWLAFRDFLIATLWDFRRRNWLGRTLHHGYVRIRPDVYSPAMLRELLAYALTLDAIELERCSRLGVAPRFQMINAQRLIAIDSYWSLLGIAPAFEALRLYREVFVRGARYAVPRVAVQPPRPLPAPRYYYVGRNGDEDGEDLSTGLRDLVLEAFGGAGCVGARRLGNGRVVMDAESAVSFDVDTEAAALVLELELDHLLDRSEVRPQPAGAAYRHYAALGCLSLSPRQYGVHDQILRRTAFRARAGLGGAVDIGGLLAASISERDYLARIGASALTATQHKEQLPFPGPWTGDAMADGTSLPVAALAGDVG